MMLRSVVDEKEGEVHLTISIDDSPDGLKGSGVQRMQVSAKLAYWLDSMLQGKAMKGYTLYVSLEPLDPKWFEKQVGCSLLEYIKSRTESTGALDMAELFDGCRVGARLKPGFSLAWYDVGVEAGACFPSERSRLIRGPGELANALHEAGKEVGIRHTFVVEDSAWRVVDSIRHLGGVASVASVAKQSGSAEAWRKVVYVANDYLAPYLLNLPSENLSTVLYGRLRAKALREEIATMQKTVARLQAELESLAPFESTMSSTTTP